MADLTDEQSIINAIAGSDYVVHTASPFDLNTKISDEQTLIKPAVDGTLAVCKASQMAKVKRVVITASVVSMMHSMTGTNNYSDKDWSDITDPTINAYGKSKTLAEKAAWDFVKNLPEGEKFELATIHPALTFGPNFVTEFSTSVDIMTSVMLKKIPGVPKMCMGIVDVRDVAQAHLAAIKVPEAAGKRFLMV